jgi:hypothetical protein
MRAILTHKAAPLGLALLVITAALGTIIGTANASSSSRTDAVGTSSAPDARYQEELTKAQALFRRDCNFVLKKPLVADGQLKASAIVACRNAHSVKMTTHLYNIKNYPNPGSGTARFIVERSAVLKDYGTIPISASCTAAAITPAGDFAVDAKISERILRKKPAGQRAQPSPAYLEVKLAAKHSAAVKGC